MYDFVIPPAIKPLLSEDDIKALKDAAANGRSDEIIDLLTKRRCLCFLYNLQSFYLNLICFLKI